MKNYLIIALFFIGLIGVRFVEKSWFYDPFLAYFKNYSLHKEFPKVDFLKLTFSHIFRYTLNTGLSLGIIYFWFKNTKYVKFSYITFISVFILLYPLYIFQITEQFSLGKNPIFTIRRFIIQPILLFLLIPSFYYLSKMNKKN